MRTDARTTDDESRNIASRAMAGKLRPCLLTRPSVLRPVERSKDTSLPRHIIEWKRTAEPPGDVPKVSWGETLRTLSHVSGNR